MLVWGVVRLIGGVGSEMVGSGVWVWCFEMRLGFFVRG